MSDEVKKQASADVAEGAAAGAEARAAADGGRAGADAGARAAADGGRTGADAGARAASGAAGAKRTTAGSRKAAADKAAGKGGGRQTAAPAAPAGRIARFVLPAVGVVLVLAVAAVVVIQMVLPAQGYVPDGLNYNYVYSDTKSASVDFCLAGATDDSILLCDSSQLQKTPKDVAQVPRNTFGNNDYGVNLNYVGSIDNLALWHSIAAGAYAPKLSNKKVVFITGVTACEDGGVDSETFNMRFSYSLYRAFCDNPDISQESRDYLAKRLAEQGIGEAQVAAGMRRSPVDYANDMVFSAMDGFKTRVELQSVRGRGEDLSETSGEAPSFDELREQAVADAEENTTSNDWSIKDSYYKANIDGRLDILKGALADETYSDTHEYEDIEFYLRVCKEAGLEPMIVISPVNGHYFDWIGIDRETREACYKRLRAICEDAGVKYVDYSDREYEEYFLFDLVHFGWTGWLDLEEAIVEFANE